MLEEIQLGSQVVFRWLVDAWAGSLARALESMTGEQSGFEWEAEPAGAEAPPASGPVFWWEQEFDLAAGPALWVGIPESTLEEIGARILRSAGVESVAASEARGTALEALTQSMLALAQELADKKKCAVAATAGRPVEGFPKGVGFHTLQAGLPDVPRARIQIAFSASLATALQAPRDQAFQDRPTASGSELQASKTLDLLREIELPVSVSFGRTQMLLQDVLKLTAGSVIELDRSIDEPVSLIVNETTVALGEIVVIEGNYGLRIKRIMSRDGLLRSSGVV